VTEGAIPEVEIDQVLVWHSQLSRESLEVGYRILIQPDGNWLFQAADIGIFSPLHFREVVMCSHNVTSGNLLNDLDRETAPRFQSIIFAEQDWLNIPISSGIKWMRQ
jgi:hypothetical protein